MIADIIASLILLFLSFNFRSDKRNELIFEYPITPLLNYIDGNDFIRLINITILFCIIKADVNTFIVYID